jgi:hypothetical protein
MPYAWQSPYACFNNNPIYYNDPSGAVAEGGEDKKGGTFVGSDGKTYTNSTDAVEVTVNDDVLTPPDALKVDLKLPNFDIIKRATKSNPLGLPNDQFKFSATAETSFKGLDIELSTGSETGISASKEFGKGKYDVSTGISNEGLTIGAEDFSATLDYNKHISADSDWGFASIKEETQTVTRWEKMTLITGPRKQLSFVQRLAGETGYDESNTKSVFLPVTYTQTFQSVSFGVVQQQRVINKVNYQTTERLTRSGVLFGAGKKFGGFKLGVEGEINTNWSPQ